MSLSPRVLGALLALLAIYVLGCNSQDIVARRVLAHCLDEAACEPAPPGVCEAPRVCALSASDCNDAVPSISAGDGCTMQDTAPSFHHALCSCGDFVSEHTLTVEDTSSSADAGILGAPVAINGNLTTTADVHIEGDLHVSGNLEVLEGATLDSDSVREQTGVPSCDCSDTSNLNAQALDEALSADAPAGFDPAQLEHVSSDTTMTLACGTYRVARIAGDIDLHLAITGHVILIVAGNIELDAGMDVSVAEGGLFELIVLGNVRLTGTWLLQGDPGQTPVYVLGGGTIDLSMEALISGPLYAPRAELVTRGLFTALGPVFVRRAAPSEDVLIRYESTLGAAQTCAP